MTLIVAFEHAGGLILASDSQATASTSGQPTKTDVDKLFVLGDEIGWGGSGSADLIQRVHHELERDSHHIRKEFTKVGREQGARRVHPIVNAIQQQAVKEFVKLQDTDRPEAFAGVFVGQAKDGPFILELLPNGGRQFQTPSTAIGSGDIFAAHAIRSVAHYDVGKLSEEQARALAYRVVDNAIATAAYGLGGKVQMLVVVGGKARCLDAAELTAVQDTVDIWKQKEVDALGALGKLDAPAGESEDPPAE